MVYHPLKFACKEISSSATLGDTVTFGYKSPHSDPELEDSKPIFLYDTLTVFKKKKKNFNELYPQK